MRCGDAVESGDFCNGPCTILGGDAAMGFAARRTLDLLRGPPVFNACLPLQIGGYPR